MQVNVSESFGSGVSSAMCVCEGGEAGGVCDALSEGDVLFSWCVHGDEENARLYGRDDNEESSGKLGRGRRETAWAAATVSGRSKIEKVCRSILAPVTVCREKVIAGSMDWHWQWRNSAKPTILGRAVLTNIRHHVWPRRATRLGVGSLSRTLQLEYVL